MARPYTASGTTILFGMIRCSRSIAATATSAATNGSSQSSASSKPLTRATVTNSTAVASSTSG